MAFQGVSGAFKKVFQGESFQIEYGDFKGISMQ